MSQSGKMNMTDVIASLQERELVVQKTVPLNKLLGEISSSDLRISIIHAVNDYTEDLITGAYDLGYDAKVDEEVQRHMEDYRMDLKTQEAVKEL